MLTPLNSWFAKETLALDDWPKDGAWRAPHLWANCAPRQSEQTLGSWCCRSRDGQGCGKRPLGRQCTVASFPLPLLQVSRWIVSSWVITLSYRSLLQSCYKPGVLGVKKKPSGPMTHYRLNSLYLRCLEPKCLVCAFLNLGIHTWNLFRDGFQV